MTQNQIAAEVRVSEMHASRLLSGTCARVRNQAWDDHHTEA